MCQNRHILFFLTMNCRLHATIMLCDIGITAARVAGGRDMKAYVESKCKAIKFAPIKKCDVTSSYSRRIVKAVRIDQFVKSLKCNGIKEVRSMFEAIKEKV